MTVIKNENIAPFDVDGTLIQNPELDDPKSSRYVIIEDPIYGLELKFRVNEPMVRLLLEAKHRGNHVVVWSKGGYQWAELVVRSLELEDWVDQVMTKPLAYFDDLEVQEWLPHRVFIPANTPYKVIHK